MDETVSDPTPEGPSPAHLLSSELAHLQAALPQFFAEQRWFAGKSSGVADTNILETVSVGQDAAGDYGLLLTEVGQSDGRRQTYVLPLLVTTDDSDSPDVILRIIETPDGNALTVIEASREPGFWRHFLFFAAQDSQTDSSLRFVFASEKPEWLDGDAGTIPVEVNETEQSNTSITIGNRHFLKLFRRPTTGANPDVEIGLALTESSTFYNSPAVVGHIEFDSGDGPPACLAVISDLVAEAEDSWAMTLSQADRFWQRLFLSQKMLETNAPPVDWSVSQHGSPLPEDAELAGEFLARAELLGQRTAEMHIALASVTSGEFEPQAATAESLDRHLTAIRDEADQTASLLTSAELPDPLPASLPQQIHQCVGEKLDEFAAAGGETSHREIRVHGDYHLGQVLFADDDFVIIDFEGEPDRPMDERRQKHCAMKDVAGMIRSLHYAASARAAALIPALDDRSIPDNVASWQQFWFACSARSFLHGYLRTATGHVFLPQTEEQTQRLLDLYLLEKVLYELRYELNNRPVWVAIPLTGLKDVLSL